LIINFIVTVIFVVSKLYNIIVLILTVRDKKLSDNIFVSKYRNKSIFDLKMFSKFTKKDSQEGKAFAEYINVGVKKEKGEQIDNNVMIFDPPILEHQSVSLGDNARALGNRSEQIIQSSLLLIGGIPCSLTATELDNEISTIAQLVEFSSQVGIDFTVLETNLRTLSKK